MAPGTTTSRSARIFVSGGIPAFRQAEVQTFRISHARRP